jgi:hypothetical protein
MSEDNEKVNGNGETDAAEERPTPGRAAEEQGFVERRGTPAADGDGLIERRQSDTGPPPGTPERRVLNQRLFDRRAQGSTTGELLVEVGRFAAENMAFRQKENKAAARRARKHLSMIMKLAKQRRAEISAEVKAMSPKDGPDMDDDDDGDD